MHIALRGINAAALLLWTILMCTPASTTTKGLNQIVTPDIQPQGILSISFQGENSALGNSEQMQFELGLTPSFEVAVFQGLSPAATVVGMELGLIQQRPFLLSTGILGIENRVKPQPFLEAGYYRGDWILIAGVQEQNSKFYGVFGAAYQAAPRLQITSDYINGSINFATLGVTWAITPTLSFNPAVYISNNSRHRAFGYGVLTWNVKVW